MEYVDRQRRPDHIKNVIVNELRKGYAASEVRDAVQSSILRDCDPVKHVSAQDVRNLKRKLEVANDLKLKK